MITLPTVGEIPVAGKSTAEIEADVTAAYYPRLCKTRPSVYAKIVEYKLNRVSIVGAVKEPGLYDLRSDKMSLVALIMEAKGITTEQKNGAAVIRITHREARAGRISQATPHQASSLAGLVQTPQTLAATNRFDSIQANRITSSAEVCSSLEVRFHQEGPLLTTGEVTMEQEGRVVARGWLDLGSELQRRVFLGKSADSWRGVSITDVEARLAELGDFLNYSSDRSSSGSRRSSGLHWQTAGNKYFTACLGGPPREKTPVVEEETGLAFAGVRSLSRLSTSEAVGEKRPETIVLPVRGLNIPFTDVTLCEGDTVVVEPLIPVYVSVIGLVAKPGNFDYPPGVQYNLGQTIALASGLDPVTKPRYATVYRLASDGTVARAVFQICGGKHYAQLTEALSVPIKPGDIIAVEQTPRTRSNELIDRMFRVNMGIYSTMDSLWNH